jgi:DNA-binding transcriptional MerR regulator
VDKAPDAFRTISEVADDLDVPQHVLRFWETRFTQIKPLKRGGGRRYYRPDDVELVRGIRFLLYGQGYTIRGVQRILKEQGVKYVQSIGHGAPPHRMAAPPDEAGRGRGLIGRLLGPDDEEVAARAEKRERREPRLDTPRTDERAERASPLAAKQSAPAARTAPALGEEHVRTLQSALDELIACRELLDAAVEPENP